MEELLTDNSTKPLQGNHDNWNKTICIDLILSLPYKCRTRRKNKAIRRRCQQDVNPFWQTPRVILHWFRQCSRPIHSAHKKTSVRTPTLSQDARRVSVAISPPQVTTRQSVHLKPHCCQPRKLASRSGQAIRVCWGVNAPQLFRSCSPSHHTWVSANGSRLPCHVRTIASEMRQSV